MIPKVQKYTTVYFGVSAKDANRMLVSKTYTRKISKVVIHENYDQSGKTKSTYLTIILHKPNLQIENHIQKKRFYFHYWPIFYWLDGILINWAIFFYWPQQIKTLLLIFKLNLVLDGILHLILKWVDIWSTAMQKYSMLSW